MKSNQPVSILDKDYTFEIRDERSCLRVAFIDVSDGTVQNLWTFQTVVKSTINSRAAGYSRDTYPFLAACEDAVEQGVIVAADRVHELRDLGDNRTHYEDGLLIELEDAVYKAVNMPGLNI